jgi:signal transduction histidine kinase
MRRYGLALCIIVVTLAVRSLMQPLWETTAPFALFMLATAAAAWFAGTLPAMLTGIASIAARIYFDAPGERGLLGLPVEENIRIVLFAAFCVFIAILFHRMRDDRRQLEASIAQLRRARDEAEEANRLKDEFLALVSHELRTPLNAMLGWLSLVRTGSLTPARTSHALDIVHRNAAAQAQLVGDLLDVAGSLTGKMPMELTPVDLAAIVDSAAEAIRPSADARQVRFEVEIAQRPIHVLGDTGRLTQVLWNLLTNAVKFTPAGGSVRLAVSEPQQQAQIVVEDTGAGIDPEFLPRVFERFTQADTGTTRRHGGVGLGLSIVRHIVELHGGSVIAESEGPSRGSRFTVLVPVYLGMRTSADAGERVSV